jgi:hypothetical protein
VWRVVCVGFRHRQSGRPVAIVEWDGGSWLPLKLD